MSDLPPPIPAASLIVMRARDGAPPELLMVERAGTMAFAAGAMVFPGGRVDPGDTALAERIAPDAADGAARIAAIRETIEETGLFPAMAGGRRPADPAAFRAALARGGDFGALLAAEGLRPDLARLTPFARWCPNFRETRRFDALFFLAEAPPGSDGIEADGAESVHALWIAAADALAAIDAGRAHAIFPTRRNLERLALFGDISEARAQAARHPVRRITPWVEERAGGRFVCIPDDAGYPVTSEAYETARRR